MMNRDKSGFSTRALHKNAPSRLDWKHLAPKEATAVVKGTHRRVVVVKSPDPKIFEEAIFIIREDFLKQGGGSAEVLEEARKAANDYIRATSGKRKMGLEKYSGPLLAAAGAAAAGIAWLTMHLVGV